MDILDQGYEMKFEGFLASCIYVKQSVKWSDEMETSNFSSLEEMSFYTLPVVARYEILYEKSMNQYETL